MASEAQLERRGPLDHVGESLAAACGDALQIELMPACTVLNLRGATADPGFLAAVERVFGIELPVEPNRSVRDERIAALWLGPDEWLLVANDEDAVEIEQRVRAARPDDPWLSVTDVSHSYTRLSLSGPGARQVLSQGCALDLHPDVFATGGCAQTVLAKCQALLRVVDTNSFEVWVRNSFGCYLAKWLFDASPGVEAG